MLRQVSLQQCQLPVHLLQRYIVGLQTFIRKPAARGQVVVIYRTYAELIVKSLIARHYIAWVIEASIVLLTEEHLQQHAVVANTVPLIVRIINTHNAGSTIVSQIKVAQANEAAAVVDGNLVGRKNIVLLAIEQIFAQRRG